MHRYRWAFIALSACGGNLAVVADAGDLPDAAVSAPVDAAPLDGVAPATWSSCATSSECAVVSNSCCGVCGTPTLKNVTSINSSQRVAYRKANCTPEPPCPDCIQGKNANLLASCKSKQCEAFDVSTSSYAACKVDSDCTVTHTACCSCASDDLVAVNATFGNYILEVDPACALKDCALCPAPPNQYRARCGNTGFCILESQP